MPKTSGGPAFTTTVLLTVALLGLGNLVLFSLALQALSPGGGSGIGGAVSAAWERIPAYLVYLAAAQALAAAVIVFAARLLRPGTEDSAPAPAAPRPTVDWAAGGLRLLALLQAEGRFIDFLEEDIDQYSDSQVGAAVRSIHSGCRKALHERMRIERIHPEEDGSQVNVGNEYDPTTLRLTGNVHGKPPFRGTLQHAGWRAKEVHLPAPPAGLDATVLAPAEETDSSR